MKRLGNIPALDGVRALAIVGVMGLHAVSAVLPGGFFGVDVFFVLSAFLISSLILNEVGERCGRYGFRGFYVRRALRLGPALLLWLAVLAPAAAIAAGQSDLVFQSTLVSLFYVGDLAIASGVHVSGAYTHVWSLGVEEQFYMAWPLLLVFGCRRFSLQQRLGLLAAAVPAAFLIQALTAALYPSGSYFLPFGHLLPLAAGCLAAHIFASGSRENAFRSRAVGSAALGLLLAVFFIHAPTTALAGTLAALVVALAAAALVLHCAFGGSPGRADAARLLSHPWALWLGRRSYGLYLYHRTITALLPALFPHIPLRVAGPAALLSSGALAEASYRFIEQPILKAGRSRLRRRRHTVEPVASLA